MSGSRVASHHLRLWMQAIRILDDATSHNREPCLLVHSTNFQNRCLDGVRSPRSQPSVGQGSQLTMRHYGSKPTEYWTSLPATTESHAFWFIPRTSKIVAWVVRGRQDHSHEWAKGRSSPFYTTVASKPNVGRHYQPQQRAMSFGLFHELPKSLLGWCEVAKITATSGSRAAAHHSTLRKDSPRIER